MSQIGLKEYLTSREVLRIPSSTLDKMDCNASKNNSETAPCIVFVELRDNCVSNFLYIHYPVDKQFIPNPNITVSTSFN